MRFLSDVEPAQDLPEPLPGFVDRVLAGWQECRLSTRILLRGGRIQDLCKVQPGEERYFIQDAPQHRQREFSAGRRLAHQALAMIGADGTHLPRKPNGDVVWPPGVCGSLSHTEDFCLVAVANQSTRETGIACNIAGEDQILGIGIDIEKLDRLYFDDWQMLFSMQEMEMLEALPSEWQPRYATLIFSAKESYIKAIGGWNDAITDFCSLQTNWQIGTASPLIYPITETTFSLPRQVSWHVFVDSYVVTAICLTS